MSISSQQAYQELQEIGYAISSLLSQTAGDFEIDEKIEYETSAEGRMYKSKIHQMLEHLETVKNKLSYFRQPISSEGYLQKNSRGRYEINGNEFTCGRGIEILVPGDECDPEEWYKTRIEHDGNDYYAVGQHDLNLDGIKARIRG